MLIALIILIALITQILLMKKINILALPNRQNWKSAIALIILIAQMKKD